MTFISMYEEFSKNPDFLKELKDMLTSSDVKQRINKIINYDKITVAEMPESLLAETDALVKLLQILYVNLDSPIPDHVYDGLQEIVVNMGIPRLTGAAEVNLLSKDSHKYTSLRGTLNKIYYLSADDKSTNKSRRYLDDWIKSMETRYTKLSNKSINLNDCKVLLQPKFDGVSCVLENRNGEMKWLTRGDTSNNRASIVNHVMDIFNKSYINDVNSGIKFEIMMSEEGRDRINQFGAPGDRKYKNSRQVVTALLNSKEADFRADFLVPVPLRIMNDGDEFETPYPDLISKYPVKMCTLGDRDTIKEFARDNMVVAINGEHFRTDGVVITILDNAVQKVLGRENNINNFEVAYKFTEEVAYSRVKDIEFYISEFGFITPVLVVNPVIMKGNEINRISLSNIERFKELDLSYGDMVKVLYDIIPYATIDDKCIRSENGRKIPYADKCPKCHEPLELENTKQVQCKNQKCPHKVIGLIQNFCDNLRIQNIGYSTLMSLQDADLLNEGILSLFKLKKKIDVIEKIEGFGKLKTRKIIKEIDDKRTMFDYQLFGSLGIPLCGVKTFDVLFSQMKYDEFMEMAERADYEEYLHKFNKISGIGPIKFRNIYTYMSTKYQRKYLLKLLSYVNIKTSYTADAKPKTPILFSGCRPSIDDIAFMVDHDLEPLLGGSSVKSKGVKAAVAIVPHDGYTSSKVEKAIAEGIPIKALSSQSVIDIMNEIVNEKD